MLKWLRRRLGAWRDVAVRVRDEPRSVGTILREAAVTLWSSRGGGFYGLGYLVTFVVLEIRTLTAGLASTGDVVTFLGQQVVQSFFRLAFESIVNTLQAFIWPLLVLDWLGDWGIVLLVGGWWGYGRLVAPRVARWGVEVRRKKKEQGK
jgi:hypothetical protein